MSREAQASREYEAKLERARELLRVLSDDLDRHAAAQQQTPRDWGHIGEVGHAVCELEDLHKLLTGDPNR